MDWKTLKSSHFECGEWLLSHVTMRARRGELITTGHVLQVTGTWFCPKDDLKNKTHHNTALI